jgi:thiamine-phosphate pyrophosphorylase
MTRLEGLYAVTPDWPDTPRLLAASAAILAGGCRLLQYRHKTAPPGVRREQAGALRALTRQHGARLIINDDLDLALEVDADGVHLGRDDGDPVAARARLGAGRLLGASCYQSLAAARRAAGAGADYLAFGSFFASPSKPLAERADPALIGTAKAELGLPVAGIGGITPVNAPLLLAAGADLLAVISALYAAPDPERTSREFCSLLRRAHRQTHHSSSLRKTAP